MSWTEGYVTEIGYTHGYYRELSPQLLRFACLIAGIAPPLGGSLRYLELGYGQGLSINIHAAANDGEFWGTDFNPNHAAQARALAAASGSGVTLLDDSFEELSARSELPEFDIIAIHGIWTWISDHNREIVVDIVRRKLKVGGILYISYNCFPGWAVGIPLRHLMKLHVERAAAQPTSMTNRIDSALAFAKQVADAGAGYFKANPSAVERLTRLSEQSRNYLAHEYFNDDWTIMTFSDVAAWLDRAKLSFAASADILDQFPVLNISKEGRAVLDGITDPILRQTVRDYLINQQFRRDIFVKGARRLSSLEQTEALREQAFVLLNKPNDGPITIRNAHMEEKVWRPVIEALSEENGAPRTLGALAEHPALNALPRQQLVEIVVLLTGSGHVHPAQAPAKELNERCAALNRFILERSRSAGDIAFLASPVAGAGIPVSRFHQLFLLAIQNGKQTSEEQAAFAWDILSRQGQRLVKDGKVLETPEDNLAELSSQAKVFAQERITVLTALGI